MSISKVGRHTYGHEFINIHFGEENGGPSIEIGSFCSISHEVDMFLGGNHRPDFVTTYPFGHTSRSIFPYHGGGHPSTNGNISVGNDVWIGRGATIMSGITIGDGAVIAANSHIIKDVLPYSIVGGNPAKHIRFRFDNDIINELLRIKWWDWTDSEINESLPVLCNTDIQNFIEYTKHKNK